MIMKTVECQNDGNCPLLKKGTQHKIITKKFESINMIKQNNKMFLYMFFGMLSPNRACIWDIFVPTGSFGQFPSKTMTDFPSFP